MKGAIIHVASLLAGLTVSASSGAGASAGPARPDGGADSPKLAARAEVETALGKGSGPAELQRLAATAERTLMTIAADPAASETVRARALSALAFARNAHVQAFLENFVIGKTPSSDRADRVLLRHAVVALGWQGDPRLVETLAPLLENADSEVRLDAAVALGLGRTRDAEAPLRARLATETDPAVRRQIEASLRAVTASR
jgi:hypothetical protein